MSISSTPVSTVIVGLAGVGSAIAAGLYGNFSARVMPRLAKLPDIDGIATMQQFNRNAVQAPFMTVFFGSAAMSAAILVLAVRKSERMPSDLLAACGSALYIAGFVMTIVYHVPRNDRLAGVEAGSDAAGPVWHAYLSEWTAGNTVRAVLSAVGAVALLGAAAMSARSNP